MPVEDTKGNEKGIEAQHYKKINKTKESSKREKEAQNNYKTYRK